MGSIIGSVNISNMCLGRLTEMITRIWHVSNIHIFANVSILARRVRMSDFVSWVRNFYLNHVILSRLSRESRTMVELELTHMVVK